MNYATTDIIIKKISHSELAKLTNFDNPQETDLDYLQTVLDEQSKVIDGYLRGKYSLPLSEDSIDDLLIGIHCDLVIVELNERRNYNISDSLKDRKEAAYRKLRDIQTGRILLKTNDTVSGPKHISIKTPKKIFEKYIKEMP